MVRDRLLRLAFLVLGIALGTSMAGAGERSLWILTTTNGVPFPKGVRLEGFPLLVRFSRANFDFAAVRPDGSDLRFTTPSGTPLAHEIEQWDPAEGTGAVWVRIPMISGDEEQEVRVRWGELAGPAAGGRVFDASNGYAATWHLDGGARDAVTGDVARDSGTVPVPGRIGAARHFAEGRGLAAGTNLTTLPTGRMANSTEAWIRPSRVNATIVGWGHEKLRGKVVLQYRSPPHVEVDAYFSAANVRGKARIPSGEWVHVAHTYEDGKARLYINGVPDAESDGRAGALDVPAAPQAWIGGWHGNFDFEGDVDEVRISRVARSADWIRLAYENQRPEQALVGHAIPGSGQFGIRTREVELIEGRTAEVQADAGGARKVRWILRQGTTEAVAAVDRLECRLEAGRFSGTRTGELEFQAVYADGVRSARIPVRFLEAIPDPKLTILGPRSWDGTRPIQLQALNRGGTVDQDGSPARYKWRLDGPGTIHTVRNGVLELSGALQRGELVVTLTAENGGTPVSRVHRIKVKAPMKGTRQPQTEARVELPEDNRFYAADARGEGRIVCRAQLTEPADSVIVRLTGEEGSRRELRTRPHANGWYRVEVPIQAGLVRHTVEVVSVSDGTERTLHRATNVVCGDVFLIMGQSNAVATDFGREEVDFQSPWIRTFGGMGGDDGTRPGWGEAVYRGRDGRHQVGYWGMELARHLVETRRVPICIVNGAVGGTRIDQHQRNPSDPADASTLYGRLFTRVRAAGLTHGVRGIFWHQGENDQGADGPTGGFGWETYRHYFIDLVAGWRLDYPNAEHVHVFQIWPKACAMGVDGSDNVLREVQRTLPSAVANLTVMATLGIDPPGGCHFPAEGYAGMARLVIPVVEREHYGKKGDHPVTSPNLVQARFAKGTRRVVELEFDQPVEWRPELAAEFSFGEADVTVVNGTATGRTLRLELSRAPSAAPCRVTYLDSARWSPKRVLRGTNGLAALTFCGVDVVSEDPRDR